MWHALSSYSIYMVGRVGLEPTVDFRRAIMSRVPATNTASGPKTGGECGIRTHASSLSSMDGLANR